MWRKLRRNESRPVLLLIAAAGAVAGSTWLLLAAGIASLGLTITLEPYEYRFLRDEPFAVRVTLANEGGELLRLDPALEYLSSGFLSFDIFDETGTKVGYEAERGYASELYLPNYKGMELKPGDRYTTWVDLTVQQGPKQGHLTWEKPGRYLIRAAYRWQKDQHPNLSKITASSRPIRVKVEEPAGIDKKVRDLLQSGKERSIWNLSHPQAGNYRTIIRDYPESRYAPYAHTFLAMHKDIVARSDRFSKKSVDEAVKEWLASADRYGPYSFEDYNRSRAALLLHEAHRLSEAEGLFRNILADPTVPDSIRGLAEHIIRLQRREAIRHK